MEELKKAYTEVHPRTLFNIWKGYVDYGDPDRAEAELIRRIKVQGCTGIKGPCRVLYIKDGRLAFTILSTDAFQEKALFLSTL